MNDYPYSGNEMGRGSAATMSFVLGALVGAGIALLVAPARGEETRHRVADAARRLRQNAGQKLNQARDTINEFRQDARSAVDQGREAFKQTTQQRHEPMHETRPTPGRTP